MSVTFPERNLDSMNISGLGSSSGSVSEFILLGFPCSREIQVVLFVFSSIIYLLTLMGNGAIICAVCWDQHLHTPMYILLGNFAFLEIWYVNSTVPNTLVNFLVKTKSISFTGCFLQLYFFFSMGSTECFFLSAMAFDRYFAICHPLHYAIVMTGQHCFNLVVSCWVCGFLWYLVPVILISQLPFCGPNVIDHFVCDSGPLLTLSCASAPMSKLTSYTLSSLIILLSFLFILISYALVLLAVLQLPSASSRHKAFSTCGSHLAVVLLFYGTIMVMHVSPGSSHSTLMPKIMTLFYAMVTTLFKPLIYSLRNKEMKSALWKVREKFKISLNTFGSRSRSV
ncbi:LOW QUALITY PROTEIN: olfactory receptor 11H12-like [Sciurus carolinensis]|uniref:LOW QUALITY PROTEIN: olfactory receptor 11H12-like n=1 Tax=Sciurus carolinensis TaxID=30640 RepID=UPI001FB3FD27|nr:LOW QUALITY PROTEIN: olfactory receptor 11H12-like [Sciurus carolinensis]